jgi:2-dehydro-3-deoxyphosphooctonate aldolase (KDO 8-P synthase)
MENHIIKVKNLTISNDLPFVLIAGPCQLESMEHSLFLASELKKITTKLGIPYIFKASFDKANRTSLKGKKRSGPRKTLDFLQRLKKNMIFRDNRRSRKLSM